MGKGVWWNWKLVSGGLLVGFGIAMALDGWGSLFRADK